MLCGYGNDRTRKSKNRLTNTIHLRSCTRVFHFFFLRLIVSRYTLRLKHLWSCRWNSTENCVFPRCYLYLVDNLDNAFLHFLQQQTKKQNKTQTQTAQKRRTWKNHPVKSKDWSKLADWQYLNESFIPKNKLGGQCWIEDAIQLINEMCSNRIQITIWRLLRWWSMLIFLQSHEIWL